MDLLRDIELFSDFVGDIYSAALDRENWHQVLQRLHHETGGARVFLFGYDAVSGTDLGQISAGYDPVLLKQYEEYYAHVNPYIPSWLGTSAGLVRYGDQMCRKDILLNTEFYADFLRPQEDAIGGGGVPVFNERGRFVAFGGHISSKYVDRTQDDFVKVLSLLSPHVARAFEVDRTLGGKSLKEHAQSRFDNGQRESYMEIVVVNSTRRIFYASCAAQKRLDKFDLVRIDNRNRLRFLNERIDTALQMATRSLVNGAALLPVKMHIREPLTLEKFILQILPYKEDAATVSALGALCKVNEPCLLITIEPEAPETRLVKRLINAYGLTLAEAEVAVAIDTEKGLPAIARARGVSVWTVRSQVKSIFYKLGVSRQTGIVRIVAQERHRP